MYFGNSVADSISSRSVGRCIYCGVDEGLSDEHVVPLGLNGNLVLRKASCQVCAAITSAFEGRAQSEIFGPFRHLTNMKTRRKKRRAQKTGYQVLVEEETGRKRVETISLNDYPAMVTIPVFGYPGTVAQRLHARGTHVPTGFVTAKVAVVQRQGARRVDDLAKAYRGEKLSVECEFSWRDYARLLAKIGFGAVVAQYGLWSIERAFVLDAIMDRSEDVLHWVGCDDDGLFPPAPSAHRLSLSVVEGEFWAWVSLFSDLAFYSADGSRCVAPNHLVVVGRATETLRSYLKSRGYAGA